MDGAQLLSVVQQRWPQTIRIVLSGYAQDEQTVRLLTLAHQFLSKPCDAQQVENVIDRCLCLHEVLADPGLRAVVGRIKRLPALPRIYAQLRTAMADADTSVHDIAAIVYEDPCIAAKVLQVVNSAFFRLPRRVKRLDQAVGHLGFNAIRTLAMSVEVFSSWRENAAPPELEPQMLQDRAHRIAAAARSLCPDAAMADDAMLAGLFHNIGYWILLQECPGDLRRAYDVAQTENIPLHEAERRIIGTSHAEIGAYLLGLWGLPCAVVEAIAFQHHPCRSRHMQFDVLAALVAAKCIVTEGIEPSAAVMQQGDIMFGDDYLQSLNTPFDWLEARQRVLETAGEDR
jgi:HD-like signal output (HDOD) protein